METAYVWKKRPDEWIKANPGKSYMYKELADGSEPLEEPVSQHPKALTAPVLKTKAGVYVIICEIERYAYVGQSKNMDVRLRSHKMFLVSEVNNNKAYHKMKEHYRSHGIDAFQFLHHSYCNPDKRELIDLENKIIRQYLGAGYDLYNLMACYTEERIFCPIEFQPALKSIVKNIQDDPTFYKKVQSLLIS